MPLDNAKKGGENEWERARYNVGLAVLIVERFAMAVFKCEGSSTFGSGTGYS